VWLNTTVSPCWRLLANISEFRPRNSIGAVPAYKVAVMFPLTCSTYCSICVVNPRRIFLPWMVLLGFLENWKLWNPKWFTEGNNYLTYSAHFEGHRCHSKVAMGPPSSLRAKEIQPGTAYEELYTYIYIKQSWSVSTHIHISTCKKKIEHVQSYTIIYIHVHMLHAIHIYILYVRACMCCEMWYMYIYSVECDRYMYILHMTWSSWSE